MSILIPTYTILGGCYHKELKQCRCAYSTLKLQTPIPYKPAPYLLKQSPSHPQIFQGFPDLQSQKMQIIICCRYSTWFLLLLPSYRITNTPCTFISVQLIMCISLGAFTCLRGLRTYFFPRTRSASSRKRDNAKQGEQGKLQQ